MSGDEATSSSRLREAPPSGDREWFPGMPLGGKTRGEALTLNDLSLTRGELPPLPPDTRPLTHQVAGHVYGKSSSRLGMLECGDGTILKPLPEGCGLRELAFYDLVWGRSRPITHAPAGPPGAGWAEQRPRAPGPADKGRGTLNGYSAKLGDVINSDVIQKNNSAIADTGSDLLPDADHTANGGTTGCGHAESVHAQSGYTGSGRAGSAQTGSEQTGSGHTGSGHYDGDDARNGNVQGEPIGSWIESDVIKRNSERVRGGGGGCLEERAHEEEEGNVAERRAQILRQAKVLTPVYLGTYRDPATPEFQYLRLADLTRDFRRACIADVKIGRRSYDPEATADKITKELHKYPPQQKLCFQLKGMRFYCRKEDQFTTCSKDYLRSLDENSVLSKGFARFFDNGCGVRREVVRSCVRKLDPVIEWTRQQKVFAFYASSILFVYEGANVQCACHQRNTAPAAPHRTHAGNQLQPPVGAATSRTASEPEAGPWKGKPEPAAGEGGRKAPMAAVHSDQDKPIVDGLPGCKARPVGASGVDVFDRTFEDCPCCRVEVKMIDFARVFLSDELDTNYLQGLTSLRRHLQRLLEVS